MKILLSIINCHTRPDFQQAIRDTWLPSVPEGMDVIFFRGRGATREPLPDEVFLDCDDSYQGLPDKVKAVMLWAYEHGYDFAAKVDDDVVVKPKHWLESGFNNSDFTGPQEPACKPGEIRTPFGFFYVLSRRAMKLVIDSPLPMHNNDEAWVSTVLYTNGIYLQHDPRYYLHRGSRPVSKRPLRSPKRFCPPVVCPPENAFAYCVYLNWNGFHRTPKETLLAEFFWLFERYK